MAAAAAAVGFVASILPWLADLLREWTLLFFTLNAAAAHAGETLIRIVVCNLSVSYSRACK